MKKLLPLLILTVTGLLAVPATTQAEDPKPGGPGGEKRPGGPGRGNPEERLKMMTEKLGLSQDQQDKIKAIMAKNGPQMKEMMAKGRENLSEEDKKKMHEMMEAQKEEIGAVLTPEQKEKMKEMRGPGGPGGPGGDRKGKPGEGKPGDKPDEKK
jgi:Spy/CpxP family protein refolding chaperone